MLSICIPIYNFNCVKLLQDLISQKQHLKFDSEVICIDDASHKFKETNESFIATTSIRYEALGKNIGRSKIRNLFIGKARYEYLLFLDCDVKIPNQFLVNHSLHLKDKVVYGGTSYSSEKPQNNNQILHYKYGHQKETLNPTKRKQHPYVTFKTNNFITPKTYLQNFPFDDRLIQYGHEDSLWAFTLKKQGIFIEHIDNPIIHQGLETNFVLLKKIEQSLENLLFLNRMGTQLPLSVNTIFYKYRPFWNFINKKLIRRILKDNILGNYPSLKLLDLYKLLYLAEMDSKENK